MYMINDRDYEYIINKYHDASTPFDPFNRFIRHDKIFSQDSGLDGDKIKEGLLEQDTTLQHRSHSIRKAKALEFVLKNSRISCDARDIFPAINSVDRPIASTLVSRWKEEVFYSIIPEVGAKRDQLENDGIVTIWPDYDHSVPYWERMFALGFGGILAESESIRSSKSLTTEEEDFFESIKITYEAIIAFTKRLTKAAKNTEGSERLALALKNLSAEPPKTFYEILLFIYLFFMISEHIDCMQIRSLCNFDRLLYPYYKNDLKNGISEQQILKDLAYFFLQFTAIGNYWGQPVYLGGENADGSTVINELSYVFLNVYDKMGIYNPKVQIKVAKSTPKEFICRALDMIRRGNNSIVFVSDSRIRASLENVGVSPDEARLADVKGCYEFSPPCAIETGAMVYFNLLKPLEYALHEGKDGVSGCFSGSASPSADSYESFDDFYAEYKRQLAFVVEQTIEVCDSFEVYLSHINPQPLLSATYPTCLQKCEDALKSGSAYNDDRIMFGFMADLCDSLTNIKKYVFDKKILTLPKLRDILDNNFEGNENLRLKLLGDKDKYGNNKSLPDNFALDINDFLCKLVCRRPNVSERGGEWNIGYHVARQSYTQGKVTASSPNGRLLGAELSKNLSASMGMNREGATAAILSITKIDASKFTSDATLDLGLLPSAVRGEDGLEAMYGLLMTFCKRGGHALHFNVFDAETLRDAQSHPEKYQDLQIRVCGWNVLWNNINKEEQDGFIRQAEALV